MWATDMPVEILGLQIKCKSVGNERIDRGGDVLGGIGAKVGRRLQTGAGGSGLIDSIHGAIPRFGCQSPSDNPRPPFNNMGISARFCEHAG
jgi:hypothetical protein